MQRDLLTEPLSQDAFACGNSPILSTARTGMVGVGMGDQCPRHRTPRVDPGVGGTAIQPFSGALDQAETWRRPSVCWVERSFVQSLKRQGLLGKA